VDGFERGKKKKRESIWRAALELFRVHGFKKVSINDIASKAGVSPATIYNHFGSKEGLVRETLKQHIRNNLTRYKKIIESDRPFPDRMEAIVFAKETIAQQYSTELIQTALSDDPEIRQFLEAKYRDIAKRISDFYQEGKRQGYINPKISQEAIMLYFDILRRGITDYAGIFTTPERNARLVREISSLYLYGLMDSNNRPPK
jgi:AcrR family transcriptional regulator